jgi:hypothetical protein
MEYRSPKPRAKADAERIFTDGDPEEASEAIIAAALHYEDREWVESWIIRLSQHEDPATRSAAAVSLGHLARLHGEVSDAAVDAVRSLLSEELTAGSAGDGLDDVAMFCGVQHPAPWRMEFPIQQFLILCQVIAETPSVCWDQAPAELPSQETLTQAHEVARSARCAAKASAAARIALAPTESRRENDDSPLTIDQESGTITVHAPAAHLSLWPRIVDYVFQILGERETFLRTGYSVDEITSASTYLAEKVKHLDAGS